MARRCEKETTAFVHAADHTDAMSLPAERNGIVIDTCGVHQNTTRARAVGLAVISTEADPLTRLSSNIKCVAEAGTLSLNLIDMMDRNG